MVITVFFSGGIIVPCMMKKCISTAKNTRYGHYHCYCGKILSRKRTMNSHIMRTHKHAAAQTDNDGTSTESEVEHVPVVSKEKNTSKIPHGQSSCPFCGKVMLKRNLNRHIKSVHKDKIDKEWDYSYTGTIVDVQKGLYIVAKNKGGSLFPLHVQCHTSSTTQTIVCEDKKCQAAMDVCGRSSVGYYQCPHVQAVPNANHSLTRVCLQDSSLEELVERKIISEKGSVTARELRDMAVEHKCLPIVCWLPFGNVDFRYVYFSIFCKNKTYYSTFGRLVGSFDRQNGSLNCACCKKKIQCPHKKLILWYLCQEMPDLLKQPKTESSMDQSPQHKYFLLMKAEKIIQM